MQHAVFFVFSRSEERVSPSPTSPTIELHTQGVHADRVGRLVWCERKKIDTYWPSSEELSTLHQLAGTTRFSPTVACKPELDKQEHEQLPEDELQQGFHVDEGLELMNAENGRRSRTEALGEN